MRRQNWAALLVMLEQYREKFRLESTPKPFWSEFSIWSEYWMRKPKISVWIDFQFSGQNMCSIPTCGGRNYILKWVFFVQTILADRYIHRREMWVVSLESTSSVEFETRKHVQRKIRNKKEPNFLQIRFFFTKNINSKLHFRQKLNQLRVPNRRKMIKKTSSGLIENFTIKKIEFCSRALFLENFSYFFFVFLSPLETSPFSYRGSVK